MGCGTGAPRARESQYPKSLPKSKPAEVALAIKKENLLIKNKKLPSTLSANTLRGIRDDF